MRMLAVNGKREGQLDLLVEKPRLRSFLKGRQIHTEPLARQLHVNVHYTLSQFLDAIFMLFVPGLARLYYIM